MKLWNAIINARQIQEKFKFETDKELIKTNEMGVSGNKQIMKKKKSQTNKEWKQT